MTPPSTAPIDRLELVAGDRDHPRVAVLVPLTRDSLAEMLVAFKKLDDLQTVALRADVTDQVRVVGFETSYRDAGPGMLLLPDSLPVMHEVQCRRVQRMIYVHTNGRRMDLDAQLRDPEGLADVQEEPWGFVKTLPVDVRTLAVANLFVMPDSEVPDAFRLLTELAPRRALRALVDGLSLYNHGDPVAERDLGPLLDEALLEVFLASEDRAVRQTAITNLADLRERVGRAASPANGRLR